MSRADPKQISYSDAPTIKDELGFSSSADALTSIIKQLEVEDTPLTIGVLGPWGSGKTSLMHMIEQRLKPNEPKAECIPVWFDAWRYTQNEVLWRALLMSVVEGLRVTISQDQTRLKTIINQIRGNDPEKDIDAKLLEDERKRLGQQLDDLIACLYRNIEREELGGIEVDWRKADAVTAQTAIRVGLSLIPVLGPTLNIATKVIEKAQEKVGEADNIEKLFEIFHRERSKVYRDQIRSLEQFYKQFYDLINEWIVKAGRKFVIFVDDLDRCLPEQAISVLEAIKVFLDIPGCIFILGFDREIIKYGIQVHYKEFNMTTDEKFLKNPSAFLLTGRDYLEKIIQIPFEIPAISTFSSEQFIYSRLHDERLKPKEFQSVVKIMQAGLIPNPRKIKRTVNAFHLLLTLGYTENQNIIPGFLAKLVLLQNFHPEVYLAIVDNPEILLILEKICHPEFVFTTVSNHSAKVDKALFEIAHLFDGMNTLIETIEKAPVPAPQGVRAVAIEGETNPYIEQKAKRILNCIPSRLSATLKLEPFFHDATLQTVNEHIFLTRYSGGVIHA